MHRFGTLALIIVMLGVATVHAVDQTILGNSFQVKDPGVAMKRKLVGKGKERASANTLVGNPVSAGASVTISASGGTPSQQTFVLPAALSPTTGKPFWSGDVVKGFKYKDPRGDNGPIKSAQIKRSPSGVFSIKVIATGKNGTIAVLPPNPGTSACVRLRLNGGDDYSVAFGPDSQITNKGPVLFKAKKPTLENVCPGAISTTTTSSTTTSTTVIGPTVQCCVPDSAGGAFDSPSGAFTCVVESPDDCAAEDGVPLGPGTCAGDPCSVLTTTSTVAASTTTSSSSTTTITLLPCGGVSPVCLGACPPGETCTPGNLLDPCSCVPDVTTTTMATTTTTTLVPCGILVGPLCSVGACPPGMTCTGAALSPCTCQ